ncbi:MAG TPA: phosphoribosylanthranilate isomerase [Sphingobacteriaceae bacterium]|nr:phosphoribosylanthranilate isomerase [Sphingobacteriaceae bacterium]
MAALKIKVCGMRDLENIIQLKELAPDYLGFIFYAKSPRYVETIDKSLLNLLQPIKKTAVFVNATLDEVTTMVKEHRFEAVQLHGNESPDYCSEMKKKGVEVIKAFGIHEDFNWELLEPYLDVIDYFLFDTYTSAHGGSGKTFNWEALKNYPFDKPYFLSGGIGPDNIESALAVQDERLYGLDLNSKFEDSPGLKNIELLKTVLKK